MNGDYQGLKRMYEEVEHLTYVGQNNNDSKKFKGDKTEAGPSKVVHIRNLPPTIIMAEVITLGAPFGRVDKHFLLREKGQALLQLDEVESAEAMISYYRQNPPFLHGKEIFIQFSHHQEIETNGTDSSGGTTASGEAAASGNHTILRVVLQNPSYAVGLNVLFLIFSRFGKVQKIVTFTKNNQFQAFVQYSESKEAQNALTTLEREGSFAKIEYSKFSQLEVKENNDKSWDFTISPSLPIRVQRSTGFEPLGIVANGLGLQLAYQPTAAAAAAPLTAAYAAASPYSLAYPTLATLQPQLKYPTATAASLAAVAATTPQSPVILVSRLNEQECMAT